MLVLTKKDIISYLIMTVLFIISLVTPFYLAPKSKDVMSVNGLSTKNYKIIIDAGHGEPDGGAVSEDDIKESLLNLQIAKKLQEILENEGVEVIMTRKDENNIADADKQGSIREIKVADINKRIEIANNSGADFLISIHMNKFSESKYRGWQTFYSKGSSVRKRTCGAYSRRNKKLCKFRK